MLKANDDQPVLITFHHEPSNDGSRSRGQAVGCCLLALPRRARRPRAHLNNVADPPILGDWLFNPSNKKQDPANWALDNVLSRAPFMGIDLYQNGSGKTMADRIPIILDYLADHGYPKMMVGIGETGLDRSFLQHHRGQVAQRVPVMGGGQHRQGRRRVLLQLDQQLQGERLLAAGRVGSEDGGVSLLA